MKRKPKKESMKNEKKKKKGNGSTILLVVIFLIGLSLLLYPSVSDYYNSFHQTRAVASYSEAVKEIKKEDYAKYFKDAAAYNKKVAFIGGPHVFKREERKEYNSLLNIDGSGILGYIEIQKIRCSLPIYHGTDDTVLQVAIGHIEGSSLPVGGKSTHTVLSGHRGLPSAKLFSDLDKLIEGDTFTITVLDKVFTYEVDQILIVLPDETDDLKIVKDKDYCTLVTCTPYGINSHRLLVRGHRVENAEAELAVTADALQIDRLFVAPVVAAPILLLLLLGMIIRTSKRKSKEDSEDEEEKEVEETFEPKEEEIEKSEDTEENESIEESEDKEE